jgi:hypothetical protein
VVRQSQSMGRSVRSVGGVLALRLTRDRCAGCWQCCACALRGLKRSQAEPVSLPDLKLALRPEPPPSPLPHTHTHTHTSTHTHHTHQHHHLLPRCAPPDVSVTCLNSHARTMSRAPGQSPEVPICASRPAPRALSPPGLWALPRQGERRRISPTAAQPPWQEPEASPPRRLAAASAPRRAAPRPPRAPFPRGYT